MTEMMKDDGMMGQLMKMMKMMWEERMELMKDYLKVMMMAQLKVLPRMEKTRNSMTEMMKDDLMMGQLMEMM